MRRTRLALPGAHATRHRQPHRRPHHRHHGGRAGTAGRRHRRDDLELLRLKGQDLDGTLIGCDLQPVHEVAEAVAHFGHRYLDRVYTPGEQATLDTGGAAALAARFAAKEAVLKLVGVADGIDPRTIEVVQGPLGRPGVVLHGEIAERAERAGLSAIDISLTHTGDTALAVAVATVRSEPEVVA